MYFTSLEDKDHTSDVIVCIYDDIVKDLKKKLSLFMKETKIQHEVDIINKNRLHSKSKSTSVSDPIVHSKINSSSKQNNISNLTPPICDSTIQTSTITDLTPPILTPTNPTISNPSHLKKKCDMCDNLYKVSDALARETQNSLNKICVSCYINFNKEILVSNDLETTIIVK